MIGTISNLCELLESFPFRLLPSTTIPHLNGTRPTQGLKMKISSVLNCSFPSWYKHFENITIESIIIPLPETFITYLHTDGLVLPEGSTHGLYTKSANMAMDGDDDDADVRDDELMKMYEADWSTPNDTATAQAPEFGEFEQTVKAAVKSLGGRVFPKLNWSCPKDAHWISFDKTLMCTCASDVYLLLKSSQFIAHDLDQPFLECEDWSPGNGESPPVTYSLVLRKWQALDPSTEFRCFVFEKRLIGVCQRNCNKFYPHIMQDKAVVLEDILSLFNKKIVDTFPESSYVFDVARLRKGQVLLIDFNPYGPVTDTLMFTWEDLEKLTVTPSTAADTQLPCFKCVESEAGIQSLDYVHYSLPLDIQDLTAGQDPYKFMDLMKMKIQCDGDSDSSADNDDNDDSVTTNTDKEEQNKCSTDKDVDDSLSLSNSDRNGNKHVKSSGDSR